MNKIVARCLFICTTAVCIIISISSPAMLSDGNLFLKNFVNHEFLNLLGVIVAITLASAANIHLEFNKIEDIAGRRILVKTRAKVRSSLSWLVTVFALAFVVTLLKTLLPQSEISMSLVNSIAILIVLFNILVLVDLTQLVFSIPPMFELGGDDDEPKKG